MGINFCGVQIFENGVGLLIIKVSIHCVKVIKLCHKNITMKSRLRTASEIAEKLNP